jgi:hypothetical protein
MVQAAHPEPSLLGALVKEWGCWFMLNAIPSVAGDLCDIMSPILMHTVLTSIEATECDVATAIKFGMMYVICCTLSTSCFDLFFFPAPAGHQFIVVNYSCID